MNNAGSLLALLLLAPIAMYKRFKDKGFANPKSYLIQVILCYSLMVTFFFYPSVVLFIIVLVLYVYLAIQSDGLEDTPPNEHDDWQAKAVSTYQKIKEDFPQYGHHIDESLALDDFARYKLEKSYAEQEISVLKEKLSTGTKGIKKGSYGVLLLHLHELGELNK